jgi:hypothetical protein
MQNPVTPIFEAALIREGSYDTGRVIARLSDIVHHGAVMINDDLLRVGAVEIHLAHFQPPPNKNWHEGVIVADGTLRERGAATP